MTNGIFGGAVLTALKQELHTKCATKVAPPILLFLLLWDSAPSLAEGARGWVIANEHNVRAWQSTGKESLMILALYTVDCFALLAMTIGISCHVER